MILSHKYKFIFFKTNKTAGTSVEVALSKFCGEEDIITPVADDDEETRSQLGYRGAQNYQDAVGKKIFYNHISAKKVREIIDAETWGSYYKFCFERNPWDRVVSLYYWKYKQEPRPPIADFINQENLKILRNRGLRVYTKRKELLVDRICLYEKLEEELEFVCNEVLGIPEKPVLPHCKSGYRPDRLSYREILSEGDRDKIAQLFSKEIALLGYEY